MTRVTLHIHAVTVLVATSYLTLGIFSPHSAEKLWGVYAIIVFILAVADLALEREAARAEKINRKEKNGQENGQGTSPNHA